MTMTTNSRLAQYQSTKSAELPNYEGAEIRPYLQRINPVNTDEWGWAIPIEQALAAGFDSLAEWEIKKEMKEMEGNPYIKSKRRAIASQLSRGQIISAVPGYRDWETDRKSVG